MDELDLYSWEGDLVWIGVKLHRPEAQHSRINHHERQPPLPLQKESGMVVQYRLLLLGNKPVVTWSHGALLVHLSVARLPVLVLRTTDS